MKIVSRQRLARAVRFLTVVAALGVVSLPSSSRAAEGDEKSPALPTNRIVMFSSGVAFYERAGQVDGNATVDLQFNVDDVNDLLQSMVLQDLGGGQVASVSYGSRAPVAHELKTFAIDLTSNPTLADVLAQVRGEEVTVSAPNEVTGTIIGVEKRKQAVGKDSGETIEVAYLNLLTESGLRSIPLNSVGSIKLTNPKLDAELRQALKILAMSHSTDKKAVTLNFLGKGKRDVRVGYIQESPIWKTSYRLVLGEGKQPPLLQGWAIVENTTEEDWKDVQLSLVSGRPISFVMDLYDPLFIDRPVVQPELYASLRPQTYDQDLAGAAADFRKAAEKANGRFGDELARRNRQLADKKADYAFDAPAAPPADAQGGGQQGKQSGGRPGMNFRGEGFQSVANTGDVGEMFRYDIANPVTVQRQRSAMLPIVNAGVEGKKVDIYNPATHAKHPLYGLRFKNSTELHLMQGPVTVFDGGAYAGDALIQDLPPGTERLISYAMDLDTEVAPTSDNKPEELVSVAIVKGTLRATRRYQRTQSYVVKNSGDRAKTVLIEYPLDSSWKLIAPEKPEEKTRDLYRFAVEAAPGKPAALKVEEEKTVSQSYALVNLDNNMILYYINAKVVGEPIKAALQEVIKRKNEISQVVAKRQELERQIQVIFQEQNRIRQNMGELPKDSDLFRTYVQKFTTQENQIESLREEVNATVAQEKKLRESLNEYLTGLDIA